MILAIDIGNSNITVGCVDEKNIFFIEHLSTMLHKTPLEYCADLHMICNLYHIEEAEIEGAIVSSVVPPVTISFCNALRKLNIHKIKVVGPGIKTGLNIKIENPSQLGSDLAVNAVAALSEYSTPLIITDLGTATSLSVLNEQGSYIGGCLLPGVGIALDSLCQATSQLPMINLEPPKKVIGRSTIECMKSGALYGNAAMIDGMIDRFLKELKETATLIATGAFAYNIIPHCKHKIKIDQELLLKGLRILYLKN